MIAIRPEARRLLLRWLEPVGTGVAALWLISVAIGAASAGGLQAILPALGAVLLALWSGASGVRVFLSPDQESAGGPGLVTVEEGKIGYFGPEGGGFASLSALARVELWRGGGHAVWRFIGLEGGILEIPTEAAGAERLIDVLSGLPGLDYQALIEARLSDEPGVIRIWQRA